MFCFFTIMYKAIPDRKCSFKSQVPGAVIELRLSSISNTELSPLASEIKALEPSHIAVTIVTGRRVADWLLYIPEITAEKKAMPLEAARRNI